MGVEQEPPESAESRLKRPLDPRTFEGIAELICGDGQPWDRRAWQLPGFFERAGLPDVPDYYGPSRHRWALDRLEEYRDDLEVQANILRRIADPREYRSDLAQTARATQELNQLLLGEGLRIDHLGMTPRMLSTDSSITVLMPESLQLAVDLRELTSDSLLGELLKERWLEAGRCMDAQAFLAATIILGSLLEGALLGVAKEHRATAARSPRAPREPIDRSRPERGTRPAPVEQWKLVNLIEVAHNCGWIDRDVKEFSHSLRRFRNLVHPEEQRKEQERPDWDTCDISRRVVAAALNDLVRWQQSQQTASPSYSAE
jgi:hypothetical protein